MSSRKRKHNSTWRKKESHIHNEEQSIDPALFVLAHEANITRGPRGHVAALSLEIRKVDGEIDVGSGLIPLNKDVYTPGAFPEDEDVSQSPGNSKDQVEDIWVDRYDARLLLDPGALSSLATKDQPPAAIPSSPTGWSDLPSDAEDTFFLTAEETEDYRREKRRKLLDQNREERLKGRMEEDGEEMWGESDEEPEESQKEIMRRTAKSLLSSPNPAQLEIRILANHGADARFAFLRGRWGRAWKTIKAHARADKLEEDQKVAAKTNPVGIGLVADYGDSDESGEGGEANEKDEESVGTSEPSKAKVEVEAARRERAREWIANRKLAAST